MDIELTNADLLVVAGNGAFIWIVMRMLVRPWLVKVTDAWWYPGSMNLAAVIIGLAGAFAATALPGFSYANILNAVLVALGGAVVAVGGNEMIGNMLKWYSAARFVNGRGD